MEPLLQYAVVALLTVATLGVALLAVIVFTALPYLKDQQRLMWRKPRSLGPFDISSPWIDDAIRSSASRHEITLSEGAHVLLAYPVREALDASVEDPRFAVSRAEVEGSIENVIRAVLDDPDPRDVAPARRRLKVVTSLSLLRGLAKRYCNIPPFCTRVEGLVPRAQ